MDVPTPLAVKACDYPGQGLFWPGSRSGRKGDYECFDGFHLVPIRHLPTQAALDRARDAFGDAATPVLSLWAGYWRRSVGDIEAYAADIGHVEPWDRSAARDALRRGMIDELGAGHRRHEAARDLVDHFRALDAEGPVRDVAFHVLEDAMTLVGHVDAGVPLYVAILKGAGAEEPEFHAATGDSRTGFLVPLPGRGEEPDRVRRRWRGMHDANNPNWCGNAFARHAGRGMALCSGFSLTVATLLDMAAQGHAKAFLKHVAHKGGTWVVDLRGATVPGEIVRRLGDALGLALSDLASPESSRNTVAVQGFLPFRDEHRFFVVGHRVVASTPSDRRLGPLDAVQGRILRPGVARLRAPPGNPGAYDRGEADVVEDRATLARMAWGARALARDLRKEGIFPPNYVIDMGSTGTEVRPVEVNTFWNAARYGADFARVARSLARWYSDPARYSVPDPLPHAEGVTWRVTRTSPRPSLASRLAEAVRGLAGRPASPGGGGATLRPMQADRLIGILDVCLSRIESDRRGTR